MRGAACAAGIEALGGFVAATRVAENFVRAHVSVYAQLEEAVSYICAGPPFKRDGDAVRSGSGELVSLYPGVRCLAVRLTFCEVFL